MSKSLAFSIDSPYIHPLNHRLTLSFTPKPFLYQRSIPSHHLELAEIVNRTSEKNTLSLNNFNV